MAEEYEPLEASGTEKKRTIRKDKLKALHDRQDNDFRWLMSDERGRRFMWRLIEMSGVRRRSYDGSTEMMLIREGERNIGLRLMADLERIVPDLQLEMMKEQRTDGNG